MEEREIDLTDLLLNILLHWRGLIVLMLIGGVLLGAFSYIKSDNAAKAVIAAYNEQSAALEEITDEEEAVALNLTMLQEQLTATQIANVRTVIANEDMLRDKQNYLDRSILMEMDPNCIPEEQIVFAVLADDPETANSIARVYEGTVASNGLTEYLADRFHLEESAVDELYSVGLSTSNLLTGANSFKLFIMHSDKNTCQEMADAAIEYAKSLTGSVTELLGEHELVVVGQYYSDTTNTGILNNQKTYANDVIALDTSIAKAKDAFSDEEVAYYNYLTNSNLKKTESPEEEAETEGTEVNMIEAPKVIPAHVSVKYVLIGIVLFAFLYAGVIAVKYILSNRLKACDNLQSLYGISVMGQIPGNTGLNKKPLQFIDDQLIKLWNRSKRQFTAEEAVNLASVSIKIAAKNAGVTNISLIGCNMAAGTDTLCRQIKENLAASGVTVEILNNVIYDAEAMEKLNETPAAVIIEKVGSTMYGEIEEELALLKRQNIKPLGAVVAC